MTDLLTRLRQLARAEHDDLDVVDEAVEEIINLRADVHVLQELLERYKHDSARCRAQQALNEFEALQSQDREDALRYRYLLAKLQQAYDGECFESECLSIYCRMSSQFKGDRTIQAEITWRDKTDEPLGLSETIDHARRIEGDGE